MAAWKGIFTWSVCLLWPSPLETELTAPGRASLLLGEEGIEVRSQPAAVDSSR